MTAKAVIVNAGNRTGDVLSIRTGGRDLKLGLDEQAVIPTPPGGIVEIGITAAMRGPRDKYAGEAEVEVRGGAPPARAGGWRDPSPLKCVVVNAGDNTSDRLHVDGRVLWPGQQAVLDALLNHRETIRLRASRHLKEGVDIGRQEVVVRRAAVRSEGG